MDKKVEILNRDQIRYVYRRFLKKDFPDNERKPLAAIERAAANKTYDCFGLFDGEEICGYAFFVKYENGNGNTDYLLDYFATRKELRGRGFGSTFFGLLKNCFPAANCILIEVEDPDCASGPDLQRMQTRRLQFYLRNGARMTGVTARVFGVEYRILECMYAEPHSDEQVKDIYGKIYRSILPQWIYRSKIRTHEETSQKAGKLFY